MLTSFAIHQVPRDTYDRIGLPETSHNGTRWKTIVVGDTEITFFPLRDEPKRQEE